MIYTKEQKKAINSDSHTVVTANAGSGKTSIFASRFVEKAIALEDLRKIIAITYTEKASAELYKKIANELDKKILTDNSSELLKKLRSQLVSANISTIHSFCVSVLKKFPIESNLDVNFTPIDARISSELLEKCVEELVKNSLLLGDNSSEDIKYLIRVFASKKMFSRVITELFKKRDTIKYFEELIGNKNQEELADFFDQEFNEYFKDKILKQFDAFINNLSEINSVVLEKDPENRIANEFRNNFSKFIANKNKASFFEFIKCLSKESVFTKSGTIKINGYLNSELRDSHQALQDKIDCSELYFKGIKKYESIGDEKILNLELAKFNLAVFKIFKLLNELYESKKMENAFIDFEDIILKTNDVMKNSNVVDEMINQFDYIMIDEYQDTNQTQYDLVMPILDNLKRGNLFVVGDEKQSIYRFRNAELEVFNQTKIDIEKSSGQLIELLHSFRMAKENCLFTNIIFEKLFFSEEKSLSSVTHSPLICGIGKEAVGKVEFLFSENENEAELVAKRILKMINESELKILEKENGEEKFRGVSFRDIAVLCRKRSFFLELEKAFEKYKVPFLIMGGLGFYQRQVIFDIYNYLAFLSNEMDDLALVSLLRSPFFSFSELELFELSQIDKTSYWEKLKSISKHQKIIELLQYNIAISKKIDVSSLLREILKTTPFITVVASRANGKQELENIEKLISLSIQFSSNGFFTLFDFVDFLKTSIIEEEKEGQAAVISDDNMVKIMTLHQAKGLEFPVVVLFSSEAVAQKNIVKSKTILIHKEVGFLTSLPVKNYFEKYSSAPICKVYDAIENEKNREEIKRLLYVGITRAARFLFISAKKEKKYSEDSFIGLIESSLFETPNFNNLLEKKEESISLSGEIKFLNIEKYINEIENLNINIPLVTEIEDVSVVKIEDDEQPKFEVLIENKKEYLESDEIYSASKISTFINSPKEYYLRYDLGLKKFYKIESVDDYESDLEPDEQLVDFSRLKGTAIHLLLSKNIKSDELTEKYLKEIILNEIDFPYKTDEAKIELFGNEIMSEMEKYFNSKIYLELIEKKSSLNEYEIYFYSEVEKYFLHGILDKLIIDGDNATIIDFKTNNIQENQLNDYFKKYSPQLKFYSLLVKNKFPSIQNFSIRIIFTKFPEKVLQKSFSVNEIDEFEKLVTDIINKIRRKNFE
ncbi:MAG: hypothetical protein C0425_07055 [Chlorobiaceae bacterium]|nr:hypothetical protein [Chlorobiaceae bacterium]MBA4310081.1 hypothetical protein [Chlorobiaceae bacterium]